jgi:hypothetical protein
MSTDLHLPWDDPTDNEAEVLLARAAAGEAVFCEPTTLVAAR